MTSTDALIAKQVELEAEALSMGQRRYLKELSKKGHADTKPGERLLRVAVGPLAASIGAWLEDPMARVGGGTAGYLRGADPEELALLTLRMLLGTEALRLAYTSTAISLGGMVEEHLAWTELATNPDTKRLSQVVADALRKATSERHRRAAARSLTRRHGNAEEWTKRRRLLVGGHLIERVFQSCPDLWQLRREGAGRWMREYIVATDITIQWLEDQHARAALLFPVRLPMVVPPKDWAPEEDGGYLTLRSRLVKRTHGTPPDPASISPDVYEAVNALQRVPWRINRRVYEVMREAWESASVVGGLPAQDDTPLPVKPWEAAGRDVPEETELRDWKREASNQHSENNRLRSKRLALRSKLELAERMVDFEAIYYPVEMDWRGRVYPVGNLVNPQADDSGRALLEFANAKPLGEDGLYWLAVHLANSYGFDKATLDERVEWVTENLGNIIDSGVAPLDGEGWWTTAEKPWTCLAACFEYSGALLSGAPEEYLSRVPVAMDGSCNGLQHLSALLLDEEGGAAVNLVPAERPADVYSRVSDMVPAALAAPEVDPELRAFWLHHGVDRKLVKRPVMTLPYGVTKHGMREQILEEARKRGLPGEGLREHCGHLAAVVWDAIGGVVHGAQEAMAWFQSVAQVATKAGRELTWVTPMGFPVRQGYRRQRGDRIKVVVGGVRRELTLRVDTSALDAKKQQHGISPNVVHSLDAAHLMLTVLTCVDHDVRDLGMVHDSYATHACDVTVLNVALRRTFVSLYQQDVLGDLHRQFCEQLPGVDVPPPPAKGGLLIEDVEDSPFFFS